MKIEPDDVYLVQIGMAAIHRLDQAVVERCPGTILVLGSVFPSTWHLFNERPGGMKHIGDARDGAIPNVRKYLKNIYKDGETVSYAFLGIP